MTEKLKNYLGWVLIISILLVAFSAWRYVSAYARSIQPASFRSFSASGEGKVVVVPDVAKFTFSVITEGDTDISKLQTSNTDCKTRINRRRLFQQRGSISFKLL